MGATADIQKCRGLADVSVAAIGQNLLREKLIEELCTTGFELATVVHPRAIVSPKAEVGAGGGTIMAGAIIGTEAYLGKGSSVNCGAVVDHHCRVEDFGHAAMAGGSVLGRDDWMQAGSALGYGVKIDADAILAPGKAVSQC